jgi:hypothetical protein
MKRRRPPGRPGLRASRACEDLNGNFWVQSGHSTSLRPVRDVLRDRSDLKRLTGCADFMPNNLAHQKPYHWGYEGNRAGLGVGLVLAEVKVQSAFAQILLRRHFRLSTQSARSGHSSACLLGAKSEKLLSVLPPRPGIRGLSECTLGVDPCFPAMKFQLVL